MTALLIVLVCLIPSAVVATCGLLGVRNSRRRDAHTPPAQPRICDCPDGAEHPCNGTGWCAT